MSVPAVWQRGERGSATVWAVGAFAVVALLVGAVGMVGHIRTERTRAAAIADIAALTAGPQADPCTYAATVAQRNGATLTHCERVGIEVRLGVAIRVPLGEATAQARAAPSWSLPSAPVP
ncbi:MAG: flp pilus-assembly TadE/G-like family protein [Bowdeniella nasicola]|nr:flp pilus-assembly TadE/G-like family protein [Bowdeniella nasicola]